jgi:hypothetical protein
MNNMLEHNCKEMPEDIKIIENTHWMLKGHSNIYRSKLISTADNYTEYYNEEVPFTLYNIKACPFCSEKLGDE